MMNPEDKICSLKELQLRIQGLPRPLVMTNGVFDILHRGHVSYLHQAATHGATFVVAVNSDMSVRMLDKGSDRPFISAVDRAYMLACLSSVDLLILFDERSPLELIKKIRPDIYVKGGDYNMQVLEETKAVRQWGGKAIAIPFLNGFSTTSLVERIRQNQVPLLKAAFLDRDGVINIDKGYIYRWSDFEFLPGAIEGMLKLQKAGYALVIVTNQSGLARGYYTDHQYEALSITLKEHLTTHGIKLAGLFHCPHHPSGSIQTLAVMCDCRKPKPGLINQAINSLGLDRNNSILIGDKLTDIEAARAANLKSAYLVSSHDEKDKRTDSSPDGNFPSLLECVNHILH